MMKIFRFLLLASLCLSLLFFVTPLKAQEQHAKIVAVDTGVVNPNQTAPGAGNINAIRLAQQSPLVQSAKNFLVQQTQQIQDVIAEVSKLSKRKII